MASNNLADFLAGNEAYAARFTAEEGAKPMPPGRKTAVICCMDARCHPEAFLGLKVGDSHMIRNAGQSARATAPQLAGYIEPCRDASPLGLQLALAVHIEPCRNTHLRAQGGEPGPAPHTALLRLDFEKCATTIPLHTPFLSFPRRRRPRLCRRAALAGHQPAAAGDAGDLHHSPHGWGGQGRGGGGAGRGGLRSLWAGVSCSPGAVPSRPLPPRGGAGPRSMPYAQPAWATRSGVGCSCWGPARALCLLTSGLRSAEDAGALLAMGSCAGPCLHGRTASQPCRLLRGGLDPRADCGMLTFDNPTIHKIIKDELGADASGTDFLPFK